MTLTLKTRSLATLAAASLLALPVLAQDTAGAGAGTGMAMPMPMDAPPMSAPAMALQTKLGDNFDRLFALKAFQGNLAEVMTSQLALQKSKDAQVRRVAQMLIQEHGQANRELAPIITAMGLPLPRTVGAMNVATYTMLSKLKGAGFDQNFMAGQVEAHEAAILLYQQEQSMGKEDTARAFAAKYLPPILGHAAMIYTVADMVKAPGSAERKLALRVTPADMTAMMSGAMMMSGMDATSNMTGGTTNSTMGGGTTTGGTGGTTTGGGMR